MTLSEKEVIVLDRIARNAAASQRALSKATGISLGLINVILKKFLRTGFIKVTNLNKRQVEYLLTPAGMLAATRRTYHYATNVVRNYGILQRSLRDLLQRLYGNGYRYFSIHGEGELRELIQSLFSSWMNGSSAALGVEHRLTPDAVVLSITADPMETDFRGRVVNILESIGGS